MGLVGVGTHYSYARGHLQRVMGEGVSFGRLRANECGRDARAPDVGGYKSVAGSIDGACVNLV